jgi:dephospho-CoA kinase
VTRVLITGMSGTGKTTVLDELRRRGHATLDTDYGDWTLADGKWDEPRLRRLLDEEAELFVSGAVENQGHFYDRFGHVVLLTAPLAVVLQRLAARTNNPYGQVADEREEVRRYFETVEPLLRTGATAEFDTTRYSPTELADELEQLALK